MRTPAKQLYGLPLEGGDGRVGTLYDLLFDDQSMALRYLVASVDRWFLGRQVLLEPSTVWLADGDKLNLRVGLSKQEVRGRPDADTDLPVARQRAIAASQVLVWEAYWTSVEGTSSGGDPCLRSTKMLSGLRIYCSDGPLGHLDDFLIDLEARSVSDLVIDTRTGGPASACASNRRWSKPSTGKTAKFVSICRGNRSSIGRLTLARAAANRDWCGRADRLFVPAESAVLVAMSPHVDEPRRQSYTVGLGKRRRAREFGDIMTDQRIEQLAIDTIRTLAMDAVQAANSGHPGTPMALAPAAYVLWNEVLRYDPAEPAWPDRDRFVLSCGHASMLLYAVLHLSGVKQLDAQGRPTDELAVTLEAIRQFRQLHSRCPGHPEHGHTSGVETTTGPLGQGIGNSVGMAMAQRWLAERYNRPGFELFDFNVYAMCSDGDLMEGIGGEVASLAGHLKLSNLCWIYDDNHVTIEGNTALAFSEDVPERFAGYGWNVIDVADVNDLDALRKAIAAFHATTDRPTLVKVRSVIGYGAPKKAGTSAAHGAPLGEEEVRLAKRAYGWPEDAKFLVPEEVPAHFRRGIGVRGAEVADRVGRPVCPVQGPLSRHGR